MEEKNRIRGFAGPSGIYYDAKWDEIFILEKQVPIKRWAVVKNKKVVDIVHMWVYDFETKEGKTHNTALEGMDHCVLLEMIK